MCNASKYIPVGWLRPKGICYVSDKFNIIFLTIPKNASTSVRNMAELDFYKSNLLSHTDDISKNKYRIFTVIRNPLDRLISGYIEVCTRASGDSPHILTKDFYWENGKKRFTSFIDELEKGFFDIHLLPQSYFLTDYNGNSLPVDAYIDIDHFSVALPALLQEYKVPVNEVLQMNTHDTEYTTSVYDKMKRKIKLKYFRRSIYYVLDSFLRTSQRRKRPGLNAVRNYINDDNELKSRLNKILHDDIVFMDKLKHETTIDLRGIYWRHN